ncbi:MAG: tetratricopeptide repeat protein [Proteiniphilum sp.]|jgi:tetratricopeptide (TPR) repeat protein|nr:tetratricopeptide repeat protein [Proteiniphilum sp.]
MLLPVCFAGVSQTYNQWLDLAGVHIEGNRFDSAAVALQRAMALDPSNENNPVLLLNLGILQRQSGLYDDAFISLTASMANNPLAEAALYNRASLLCDMERFDEAMDDYNTLIRNYPESVEAYYRRGLLFLEKNDRAAAEADFKASEAIDRENVYTKLSRALLCKLDDDWEGAERIYTELIQSSSSTAVDPGFYMGRAECYVNTEQLFKASADLRVVEKSQRENPYFHILRGRVRLGQFDKVAARADFRTALELGYDAGIVADWLKKTE